MLYIFFPLRLAEYFIKKNIKNNETQNFDMYPFKNKICLVWFGKMEKKTPNMFEKKILNHPENLIF